jgi:hypothetical protein
MNKIMLAATVLLCSSMGPAFAQGNPIIHLSVHDSASSGSDGYTNVEACGATYSYRYTGGTGKGGDVAFTKRGKVSFPLKLDDASPIDQRYTIADVTFKDDVNKQLSASGNAPTSRVIHDKNDAVQTASYKVVVNDATAECEVPCDPLIQNREF